MSSTLRVSAEDGDFLGGAGHLKRSTNPNINTGILVWVEDVLEKKYLRSFCWGICCSFQGIFAFL